MEHVLRIKQVNHLTRKITLVIKINRKKENKVIIKFSILSKNTLIYNHSYLMEFILFKWHNFLNEHWKLCERISSRCYNSRNVIFFYSSACRHLLPNNLRKYTTNNNMTLWKYTYTQSHRFQSLQYNEVTSS